MPEPPTTSAKLLDHFQELEDPRVDYLIEHRLLDIMGLTICAVICGADTWVDIELYRQSKQACLQRLSLPVEYAFALQKSPFRYRDAISMIATTNIALAKRQ